MKQRLIQFFKRQLLLKKQKEKTMIDNYDTLHTDWQKKVDKIENNYRKKQKDAKYREFYEKVFPELRKAREEKERLVQKQKAEQQARQDLLAKQKSDAEANVNGTATSGGDAVTGEASVTGGETAANENQVTSALLSNLTIDNTQLNAIEVSSFLLVRLDGG